MVSKRYARRYTRRFRNRRSNFSKFNLYRKKSATSQAFQIYRLNKKLNNYAKANRPKVDITHSDLNFVAAGAANTCFASPTQRVTAANPDVKVFRIHDIHLNFVVYPLARDAVFEVDFEPTFYGRVIVFKYKQARASMESAPWYLWDVTQEEVQNQNVTVRKSAIMKCLNGPLKDGITSRIKILRDFKINYNPWKERGNKSCIIKYPGTLRVSPDQTYPQNTVVWVAIWWSNLYDIQTTVAKDMAFRCIAKAAYVCDN